MKKYLYYIPIILLIGAIAYSLYVINTTPIVLGNKQYIGIAFVIIGLLLTIIRKDLGVYVTGVALLLGTFNVIAFTPVIESYSFGFSFNDNRGVDIKIQTFSLCVFIVYLVLSYKTLLNLIRKPS